MRKWIPALVIIIAFGASAAVYQDLPQRMPTHWNMSGEVDGWSSLPWAAFMMPVMLLALLAIFHLLPRIDPRRASYAKFKGTYDVLVVTMMVALLGVHLMMLATALGRNVSVARVVPAGVAILFIIIGNLLPRTRPKWFIGIRTPWTLSSDRVWERTHRFGGRLFVAAGAVIMLTALFAPTWANAVLIGCAGVVAVGLLIYSYVTWKSGPESGNASRRA